MDVGEIVIRDSELVGRRLTSSVTVPRDLRKYFKSTHFFVNYDADITTDRSILNIPLLSTVLPLAWLTGSDIYVEKLDQTFKESMDELKREFMKMFPKAPFTTSINADVLVKNLIGEVNPSERTALLFSGGVDSTYSLITNLDLKPRLIIFWGTDNYPYPENKLQWEKIISTYSEFAGELGLKFNTIRTNNSIILDDRRISHDFHEFLYDGRFRLVMLHTFVLLPLAAPLSFGRFDRLLIAAGGHPRSHNDRYTLSPTRPETDEKIVWADLKVRHDGYVPREEKISGSIKEYLQNNKLKLKVCIRRLERDKLNDSTCPKCLKAILTLLLAGIDPNECGFEVDDSTLKKFRSFFENELAQSTFHTIRTWLKFQNYVPDQINYNLYGSKEFFDWFKRFDLKSREKNVWLYRDIYNTLPYPISRVLDKFYRLIGIWIHVNRPPKHPKKTSYET